MHKGDGSMVHPNGSKDLFTDDDDEIEDEFRSENNNNDVAFLNNLTLFLSNCSSSKPVECLTFSLPLEVFSSFLCGIIGWAGMI